jgi:uncharacterized protein
MTPVRKPETASARSLVAVTFLATTVLTIGIAAPAAADALADAVAAERRDDCATAVPIYRALAAKGVADAFKRLGYFSEIGYCAKRDWVEAAEWYGKAIAAGDDASAGSLGHIGRNWRFMYRNVLSMS